MQLLIEPVQKETLELTAIFLVRTEAQRYSKAAAKMRSNCGLSLLHWPPHWD